MTPQALQSLQNGIYILTFINLIWTVSNIVNQLIGKAKTPNVRQDERITALETRMKAAEEHLNKDNIRLGQIEEGNRVTQQAILAIMRHDIDGNNMDQLREAESALQEYLINKR